MSLSRQRLNTLLKFIVFVGIGATILTLVYFRQSAAYQAECVSKGVALSDCSLIQKIYSDFLDSNVFILLSVVFLFFLSNVSRAIRWNMMLKAIGVNAKFSNLFNTIMLGYFANLGLPRIGEIIRGGVLAKKENIKFDKVMGTIVLDRSIDMLSLLVLIVITIVFSSDKIIGFIADNNNISDKIAAIVNSKFFFVIILIVIILSIYVWKSKFIRKTKVVRKILNFLNGILAGIKSIKNIQKPFWFLFHSIFIWVMYYLMNVVGFYAFSPTAKLGFESSLVVTSFGSLGFVIPSPGGMGTYHFLVIEALKLYNISGSDAFSWANMIFFSVQIFGIIFFGLLAMLFLNMRDTNIEELIDKAE